MADALTPDEVVPLLEEATQSVPGKLSGVDALTGISGWDSMGMVMFMGLVRDRTGTELTVQELRTCETVAALSDMVAARTAP